MRILPNEVTSFIRGRSRKDGLRARLEKDFGEHPFRIFREGDLHACCYFHLRQFLEGDQRWRILNQPLLRALKEDGRSALPDMMLFRKEKPVFLIEFKFRRLRSGVGRNDLHKMKQAVDGGWAKKAFYIEAVVEARSKTGRKLQPYLGFKISTVMREEQREEYLKLSKLLRKPKPRTWQPE